MTVRTSPLIMVPHNESSGFCMAVFSRWLSIAGRGRGSRVILRPKSGEMQADPECSNRESGNANYSFFSTLARAAPLAKRSRSASPTEMSPASLTTLPVEEVTML